MTDPGISALVSALEKKHGTADPFRICRGEGITVLYREDFRTLKGAFAALCGQPFVFINGTLSEAMQRMVCAHELGHALLHGGEEKAFFSDADLPGCDRREREANTFAAELLLEDREIMSLAREGTDAVQIAMRMEVHVDFVLLKAEAMNRRGCAFHLPRPVYSRFLGTAGDDAGAL